MGNNGVATQGTIYFLEAEGLPYLKIGFSVHFEKRLVQLQSGCPVRLAPMKLVKGTLATEQALLAVFAKFRVRGEWFSRDATLLAFIDALEQNQKFSPEMLVR